MKKGLLLIFVALIFTAPMASVFAQTNPPATEGRALEIIYPVLSGEDEDLTLGPDTDLASYVRYIFRFALVITGFIILYVMISAGLAYVMSSGNAETLLNAKKGILSGFLGALILIGAFILFNTINPDLTKLGKIDDLDKIKDFVPEGIYLCNKQVPLIGETIRKYMAAHENATTTSNEEIVKIAKEFNDIMKNADGSCYRANFSGNIDMFNFTLDVSPPEDHSVFVIPKRIFDDPNTPNIDESNWEWNYGIVFHEKDNFRGKCRLFRRVYGKSADGVIGNIDLHKIKSFTVFKKPDTKIIASDTGVTFSQCLNHNDGFICPLGLDGSPQQASYSTTELKIKKIDKDDLDLHDLAPSNDGSEVLEGTRSIKFGPVGSYFAILFSRGTSSEDKINEINGGDNWTGNICEVISVNDNNLMDRPIGQCALSKGLNKGAKGLIDLLLGDSNNRCKSLNSNQEKEALRDCQPCMRSAIIIRGKVL